MKTKKINLRGISEILSEKELKNVLGGSSIAGSPCGEGDGIITGYRCPGTECYIDIQCSNGTTVCDYSMPFAVCQQGTDVCR